MLRGAPSQLGLRSIHQIELTSRCNLACIYCAHPKVMTRPKIDITDALFERALAWIDHFVAQGTQDVAGELNLSGIGETLLHPSVVEYVAEIRRRYGEALQIVIPTNGLELTDELARALEPHRPVLLISMHVPARAAYAVEIAQRHGIFGEAALSPVTSPNDWAGQVEWMKPTYRLDCPWLYLQRAFVASDGRIYPCCLATSSEGVVGSVEMLPESIQLHRWKLCSGCYQVPPSWA